MPLFRPSKNWKLIFSKDGKESNGRSKPKPKIKEPKTCLRIFIDLYLIKHHLNYNIMFIVFVALTFLKMYADNFA